MLHPKPQIVRVIRPGGRPTPSLVRLDTAGRRLLLRGIDGLPASKPGGEVALGSEEVVPAELVAGVAIVNGGKGVRLMQSGTGKTLFELQLDTVESAQTWATSLQEALCGGGVAAAAVQAESDVMAALAGAPAEALQALVMAQEKRVEQLEELNQRKEVQLLQFQNRLEEALETLQAGQEIYCEQQRGIDMHEAVIAQLRGTAASMPSSFAAAPASTPAPTMPTQQREGATAESDESECDSDDDEEAPEEMLAMLRRAEELQRELLALGGSAQGGTAGSDPRPAASMERSLGAARLEFGADDPIVDGESAGAEMAQALAMQTEPDILEALQALSSEKSRLEAQLRDEQTTMEKQLQELQAQMAELEMLEAKEGTVG